MYEGEKAVDAISVKSQLDRYTNVFEKTQAQYKLMREELTSRVLKKVFDEEFQKGVSGKNLFFDAYEVFMKEKQKSKAWSHSTVKRYKNIKNILIDFEKDKKFKLTFSNIDKSFYLEFTEYCIDDKKHINNTYVRNLGLFKTFMLWALNNKYTYNQEFKTFNAGENRTLKKVITKQIALNLDDLKALMTKELNNQRLEKVRDVFVFACLTGMRFGELSLINKSNVINNEIILKEEKDTTKEERYIPLTDLSRYILTKYDYQLPLIANQKQNEYIKELFKKLEYTELVEKITVKGRKKIIEKIPFCDRISTHTARRTFITMMKEKGKSDKLIAEITGHKDMKTLNQYYQVDNKQTKKAVDDVFTLDIPLKKVAE